MMVGGGFMNQQMIPSVPVEWFCYAHCHTIIITGRYSSSARNKFNLINHCSTDYFKSSNTEVKLKQLHNGVRFTW